MAKLITLLMNPLFCFFALFILSSDAAYNVLNFGARPDGQTDSTASFLRAWNSACSSVKPALISVPRGRYLIKQAVFRGPCRSRITFQIQGTIVAPSDYRALGDSEDWILFFEVTGVSIYGGTLDAKGAGYWNCKTSGKNCPVGARSITFNWSRNILISGLTSINSQISHIVINRCTNVMVRGVNIFAPDQSPNTDGIHVQFSTGVTITGSRIRTGDDCVSIGPGTRNLWIEGIGCGPGHGISIGSLGKDVKEEGVQNVTVKKVVFTGTDNGLRIKSWARPSTGFVRDVLYENVVMDNVENPIIIDQMYCPDNEGCPGQSSGIKISEVTYKNIRGTSATPVAVKFDCSSTNPCQAIRLQHVRFTYLNRPAQSSCTNVGGRKGRVVMPGSCL